MTSWADVTDEDVADLARRKLGLFARDEAI
jgi:hypothetical protein